MKQVAPESGWSRRAFLTGVAAALGSFSMPGCNLFAQQVAAGPSREELSGLLRKLFVSNDPALLNFAVDAYVTCIVGKIQPPSPPLQQAWIVPGGGYYAQWLWDTMFVADLLAVLPSQTEIIRGVFKNYWDFQARWSVEKPVSQQGMVANFIAPFDGHPERDGKQWRTFPAYSQAPLLAWGMERVYRRNGDRQMLRDGLGPLEQFHEWYWRERDVTDVGLIGVGAYSGDVQHARYETYDREVDLDDLQLTPHPSRPRGADNGPWYGNILIPANTAYLLLSEQSLARLADSLGDTRLAARRRVRYAKGRQAMQRHMWSERDGCFVAVRRASLKRISTSTVGGFMPMMAQVPSKKQAARMASTLASNQWATPLAIPTVARTAVEFKASEFWRGDVWPAPNYQVATGLAACGLPTAAARIADASVENALKVGLSERYDSVTGAPLGVHGLGMSASIITMMLDGLTSSRYTLRVRDAQP